MDDLKTAVILGDVEVELFIRRYCIAPSMYQLAMLLFDVGTERWGRSLWKKYTEATH